MKPGEVLDVRVLRLYISVDKKSHFFGLFRNSRKRINFCRGGKTKKEAAQGD